MSTPKNVVNALKEMRLSPPRANHSKTKKNRNSQNALNTYFEELDKYGNDPMTPKKREISINGLKGYGSIIRGFLV
jgi:hypothetical protein